MIGWKAWYADAIYKSSTHCWEDLPEYGIQVLRVYRYGRRGTNERVTKLYCDSTYGVAEDPSIFRLPGKSEVKIGTMLPDQEYETIRSAALSEWGDY